VTHRELVTHGRVMRLDILALREHPGVGRHPVQRSEFRLSDVPAAFHWPAPNIGQHTVQVCKEILGMSDEEMTQLIHDNVLEVDTGEDTSPSYRAP
jgi:crotonobetainyl-CoA:carnitine CoA-transferase CaiB-like acyl-CoA transferase